jgi:PAS domain S-box-containing protein
MSPSSDSFKSLRERAEAFISQSAPAGQELSPEEMRKLVHELQVHQIELELQNDELQRALGELELSQSQFYNLFNQAPVGYLVLNEVGQIRQANQTFCEMAGREREQVMGRPLADFIDPPDREVFLGRFRAFFKKPEGKFLEARLVDRGVYTRMEGALLRDGLGLPASDHTHHLLLTISDISERRLAEEARSQSEEKFRQLAENIRQVFWLRDRKSGQMLYISPAYESIWGRTRQELYENSQSFLDNIHPEDLERIKTAQSAQQEQDALFDQQFRLIRPDGETRWLWARTFPVHDANGEIIRYAGLAEDISEAKRSEEMLLARLRLLEYSSVHSLDALMQFMMDEICALSDSPVGFFHFLQEDQRTLTLQAWSTRTLEEYCTTDAKGHAYDVSRAGVWVDCIYARQPVIHNDYASLGHRRGLPDGHAELVRQLVVPVFRCDLIVAIVGVGNKTQPYTQADADIVMRMADLAWDIIERKHAQTALQESLAANQLLLRELQHRVKNSMALIASIVSLETFTSPDAAVIQAFESLYRRVITLADLYTILYDAGNSETVRLDRYVEKIVRSLEAAFAGGERACRFVVQLDEAEVGVKDATPFGLIVNELVTNAVKYAFPAGRGGTVTIRLERLPHKLILQVQDDGVGLPPGFDPVHASGLGMQLVQGLSGQLGGTITHASNGGAQFRLEVPIKAT